LRFSQYCYWDATLCRRVKIPTFRRSWLLYIRCTGRVGRLVLSVGKNSAIVILGFRREVDENCVLLGYYAAGGGNSVPTIRNYLSVPYSGFKKQKKYRLLKVGLIRCPETSVGNCHYLVHSNPKQCSFQFDNRLSGIFVNA
jgi:hypothetical protein